MLQPTKKSKTYLNFNFAVADFDLPFLGFTVTEATQTPGFNFTSFPPETLQYFAELAATFIVTVAPAGIAIAAIFAIEEALAALLVVLNKVVVVTTGTVIARLVMLGMVGVVTTGAVIALCDVVGNVVTGDEGTVVAGEVNVGERPGPLPS